MFWPHEGYRIGHVPLATVQNAMRRIGGEFASDYDSQRFKEYSRLTFFPRLAASAEMRAYGSELANIFGLDTRLVCDTAQIALRIPGDIHTVDWHMDGVPVTGNGVTSEGQPKYEAMMGVYLSQVSKADSPMEIWPGSHTQVEKFGKEKGWNILRRGVIPDLQEVLGGPIVLTGEPGTAVLFHPYLVHRVLPNRSHNIRYALYFRYYDRSKR